MRSEHAPAQCLADIVENADRIARHLLGVDEDDFTRNEMAHDAVERCLARICEAAARLGDNADALLPDQPWASIRGFGNRLRHAYDALDENTIWTTATVQVPELKRAAARALDRVQAEAPRV